MGAKFVDADVLKSYIQKEYGTQFPDYVLRAIHSAIDKQPSFSRKNDKLSGNQKEDQFDAKRNGRTKKELGKRNSDLFSFLQGIFFCLLVCIFVLLVQRIQ